MSLVDYAWSTLGAFLGGNGVVILASVFVLIVVRVIIQYVFKVLRMNDSYELRKTNWAKGREQTWEKSVSESLDEFENGRHIFHG